MRIGSLFSGIGGLDLGVERATGGGVAWQCEANPYCRQILARHWPGVPCFEDVVGLEPPPVDLICGGFPCQDISLAGKGAGINGARSGLWSEYARIVRLLRPTLVFVENVRALTVRGLDRVLRDLATLGYDAAWDCLGACCVGAPHRRERLFILALRDGDGESASPVHAEAHDLAHPNGLHSQRWGDPTDMDRSVDPQRDQDDGCHQCGRPPGHCGHCPYCAGSGEAWDPGTGEGPTCPLCGGSGDDHPWAHEPAVGRVADGFPGRLDQLRALGNAVVPQQAEAAFRILAERLAA